MLIELHQAFGTEYSTIAACKIRFNQLLDTKHGKLHGSAILIGKPHSSRVSLNSVNLQNYGQINFKRLTGQVTNEITPPLLHF